MGVRGHGEEEVLRVLRKAESGDTVVEICRKQSLVTEFSGSGHYF